MPASLVVRMWPTRVQGGIGADAEGGYVAFNIVNCDGGTYFYASYLVVMDLRGLEVHVEVVEQTTASYGALQRSSLIAVTLMPIASRCACSSEASLWSWASPSRSSQE